MIQESVPIAASGSRNLTLRQLRAIQAAMHLFVEEDLHQLDKPEGRLYCDACQRPQPAAGFIRYCRYQICNGCATEYEIARARGLAGSVGQFVRDRQFGETLD
jgi:formate dehydrogenase maturation protein FdhE